MASKSQNRNPIRPIDDGPRQDGVTTPLALRPGIDQLKEIWADLYEVLQRRVRVFAVVAGSLAFVLLSAILLQTSEFEASSLVLVKFGRELMYQNEVGKEQTVTSRDKQMMINSEIAILHSRPVLEQAARVVGLDKLYPDLAEEAAAVKEEQKVGDDDPAVALLYAQAGERLGESMTTQALPDADVMSVAFRHPDPATAKIAVGALVDRFIEAHLEAYGTPAIAPFLDRRVADYEKRLDASEKRLLEFETAHSAFALESPQTTLMQWRDETLKQLSEVESQMAAIRTRHHEDAAVAEARNAQMRLQLQADQLEGKLRKDTDKQLEVVQGFIAGRRAETEREVGGFARKKNELEDRLVQTERELKEFPGLSAEYRSLRRERDADEEQYSTYRQRLRDARLSSEMDQEKITSISVIQPASTAPQPVWPPSKAATIPTALVLALVAGGLAAVLAERLGGTGIAWLDEGAEAR
jgi:uncharacterized protein involved in exopolysaccharide biosynthesis